MSFRCEAVHTWKKVDARQRLLVFAFHPLLSSCCRGDGLLAVAVTAPHPALAWSDERHEIVAPIAEHYLDQAARTKVAMLLVLDTDTLTDHDLASEATWAGKYRESDRDTTKIRHQGTRRCHFVDIELAEPRLDTAHFGHPPLPAGVLASEGPPQACVADRIEQFVAELRNPATGASEQLLSLKYLLHFVAGLLQRSTQPTITTPAATRSLSQPIGFTPGTFMASGISSSWRC
jgi:hypothetical protein